MSEAKRVCNDAELKGEPHSAELQLDISDLKIRRDVVNKAFDQCVSDFLSSKSSSFMRLKVVTFIMVLITLLYLTRSGLSKSFFAYASSTCFFGYFLMEASDKRKALIKRLLSVKRSVNSLIDSVESRGYAGFAAKSSVHAVVDSIDMLKPRKNDEHSGSNAHDLLKKMKPMELTCDLLHKKNCVLSDAGMSLEDSTTSSREDITKQSYICSVGKDGGIVIDDNYIRILELIPGDRFTVESTPGNIFLKPSEEEDIPGHISDERAITVDDGFYLVIPSPLVARSGAYAGDGFRILLGRSFIKLERLSIAADLMLANRFCRLLEEGRHLVSLLYLNERLKADNIYVDVGRHQCYLFIENLLFSDKMLPGFLYLNIDGIYSNCFDSTGLGLTCIFSLDSLIGVVPNKEDFSSIDLVCLEGRLTIAESGQQDGDSRLKLIAAFYNGIWQQIKNVVGDQDVIIWNDLHRLGVEEHSVNSECQLLDLVARLGY